MIIADLFRNTLKESVKYSVFYFPLISIQFSKNDSPLGFMIVAIYKKWVV